MDFDELPAILIIDHFRKAKKMPPMPVYINEEGEEISVFNSLASS